MKSFSSRPWDARYRKHTQRFYCSIRLNLEIWHSTVGDNLAKMLTEREELPKGMGLIYIEVTKSGELNEVIRET